MVGGSIFWVKIHLTWCLFLSEIWPRWVHIFMLLVLEKIESRNSQPLQVDVVQQSLGYSLHDCDRTKFIEISTGKIFMWTNQAGLESKASLDLINWPPIVYWGRHLVSKRTYRTLDSVSLALNQRFRKYWKRLFLLLIFLIFMINHLSGPHSVSHMDWSRTFLGCNFVLLSSICVLYIGCPWSLQPLDLEHGGYGTF